MLKKLGLVSVTFLIIAVVVFVWLTKDDKGALIKDHPGLEHQSTSEKGSINQPNPKELIKEILELANNGMVPETPYVAGETKMEVVHNKFGEPDQVTSTSNGTYETFSKSNISIGYHDNIIFDVRSYATNLNTIHLKKIKEILGSPDEIRYYKDEEFNQIILVYQVNPTYQLKWILPKPSETNLDPVVDHISVITEKNEQPNTEIIGEITLEEKIGQMIFAGIPDASITENTRKLINDYNVGGIIFYTENLKTPKQTLQLLNEIKDENKTNKLPLILGVDQEGGRITRLPGALVNLPTNKVIGKKNNRQFSYEIGTLLGKELNAFGFNLDFAPVLDVNSNPKNPIIGDRSFGNNSEIVSELGIQTMKGIQSENVISVIKHFPGHGDTSVDSHLELPIVEKTREELEKLELIPFRNAIENGADVVMVAHILLPKLDNSNPSSMSDTIIKGILRNELGFNGVVITDDMTMDAITNHYNIGEASVRSVQAGSDIILVAHDYEKIIAVYDALLNAVKTGEISEERINASIERIIQLKEKYEINSEKVDEINLEKLNEAINKLLDKNM